MSDSEATSAIRASTDPRSPTSEITLVGPRGCQAAGVTARAHHPAGPQEPGDGNRHPAGVPRRAQHKDALTRLNRRPEPEREPGRHRGVHRGGDGGLVNPVGQPHAAAAIGDDPLRHGSERGVVNDAVNERAVREPAHRVDAGDHGQHPRVGIVRAGCARSHARMKSGRQDLDPDLVLARRRRDRELFVARCGVEIANDGCVHVALSGRVVCGTNKVVGATNKVKAGSLPRRALLLVPRTVDATNARRGDA